MRRLGYFLMLLIIPLVILIFAIWPSPRAELLQEGPLRIAFMTNRDGDFEVYLMARDGSNPVNLTQNQADDGLPTASPTGGDIAFVSTRDETMLALFGVDADDRNVRPLSIDPPANADAPHYSPTGEWIAFGAMVDDNAEILVVDPGGQEVRNLTHHVANDRFGSWSPDGKELTYASERGETVVVYIVSVEGGPPQRVSDPQWPSGAPAWSPDGTRIAFMAERDSNVDVYIARRDGSDLQRLTDDVGFDGFPHWSPDGRKIAFLSDRDANVEIYVVDADGGNEINLTDNPAQDSLEGKFDWSPDGTQILFHSDRDGNWEVYVMDADGSNLTNLSNDASQDLGAVWLP
jgi:Tol biopolymer transport system component